MGYKRGSYLTESLYSVLTDNFWRTQEIGAITTELGNRINKSSNGIECVQVKSTKTKPIFFRKNDNVNSKFMDDEEDTKDDE